MKVKVADGREVLRGPWINWFGWSKRHMGILIGRPDLPEIWGEKINILEFNIPNYMASPALPAITIKNRELWTEELLMAVIKCLAKEPEASKTNTFKHLPNLIKADFYQKELKLNDGRVLIGPLYFDMVCSRIGPRYDNLQILGRLKNSAGQTEEVCLLTICNVQTIFWPPSNKIEITLEPNKSLWCVKLEHLIILFLELLSEFSPSEIRMQILNARNLLQDKTDWAKICRQLCDGLLKLPPGQRDDPALTEALQIITKKCA